MIITFCNDRLMKLKILMPNFATIFQMGYTRHVSFVCLQEINTYIQVNITIFSSYFLSTPLPFIFLHAHLPLIRLFVCLLIAHENQSVLPIWAWAWGHLLEKGKPASVHDLKKPIIIFPIETINHLLGLEDHL